MKQALLIFLMLGLTLSSVEAAVDAAEVAHDESAPGTHEIHHPHALDPGHNDDPGDPGDPDNPEAGGHLHVCHCGLHAPPMATALAFSLPLAQASRSGYTRSLHPKLLDPPPLRPPIA